MHIYYSIFRAHLELDIQKKEPYEWDNKNKFCIELPVCENTDTCEISYAFKE